MIVMHCVACICAGAQAYQSNVGSHFAAVRASALERRRAEQSTRFGFITPRQRRGNLALDRTELQCQRGDDSEVAAVADSVSLSDAQLQKILASIDALKRGGGIHWETVIPSFLFSSAPY
jgi:hypothetical protein